MYDDSLKRTRALMKEREIEAALLTAKPNIYYLTGRIFDGFIYITESDALCFVRKGVCEGGIPIRKPEDILPLLPNAPKILMLEEDYLSVALFTRLERAMGSPSIVGNIMREARSVKSERELDILKVSARRHAELYAKIPALYRSGMTDWELGIEIERRARLDGHLGIFRVFGDNMEIHMGSVLAGDNATQKSPYDFAIGGGGAHPSAPGGASGSVISPPSAIAVDISGAFTGYLTDMTRIFSVGSLPEIALELHKVAIEIQDTLAFEGREGVSCGALYDRAMELVKKHNACDYYMESVNGTRFTGHGLGIEINEPPVIYRGNRQTLVEGMTIAVEPKFLIPHIGAVGIENTFVVRKGGMEKLTIMEEDIIKLD